MQRTLKLSCLILVLAIVLIAFTPKSSGTQNVWSDAAAQPPQVHVQETANGIRIYGLVNRILNLTYDELHSFPMVSEVAELKCVMGSPDVAFNWTGIPLFYLLTLAQIKPEAYKVVTRANAYDGFSSDLLVEDALRPTTILALGANGTDLPEINGIKGFYRLVVPGHWGYKWVAEVDQIQVVDYDYKGSYESSGYDDAGLRPDSTVLPSLTPPLQELSFAAGNLTFKVEAFTNVSINSSTLDLSQKIISLNVTVPSGTRGFADILFQHDFLNGPYDVTVDTQTVNTTETDLTNQSYLYIDFSEGLHTVEIIGTNAPVPEFTSLIILSLLMITTLMVAMVYRRIVTKQNARPHKTGVKEKVQSPSLSA